MTPILDHLIIKTDNVATSLEQYSQWGFTVLPGGTHADGVTENNLIVLDDGVSVSEVLSPISRV